jgi:hypothetical protein
LKGIRNEEVTFVSIVGSCWLRDLPKNRKQ